MFLQILAVIAEFEANLIRQRTREGMDIARQKGKLRGKQPSLKPAQDREIRRMHDSGDYNVAEIAALFSISRATVYRTLSKLVDAGLLRKLELGSDTYYDHDYGYPQHEHLLCEQCKRLIEFQHPDIETAIREVASQHQFQFSGHTLIIRGVCLDCNRARASKRRLDLI